MSQAEQDRDELQQAFDVRWAADVRAIKRWQEAHPGNDLVWPNHADMVVWLMGEVERLSAALKPWQRIAQNYIEARDDCDLLTDERSVYIKTLVTMGDLRATAVSVPCNGCPPVGYPTDKTRCAPCPRRANAIEAEERREEARAHSQFGVGA